MLQASSVIALPATQPIDYSGTLLTDLPNGRFALAADNQWQPADVLYNPELLPNSLYKQRLSFGYTQQVLWLYFELVQQPEQPLLLELGASFIDKVSLYLVDEKGQLQQQFTGDHVPFFSRPVLARSLVLRLTDVEEASLQRYVMKVQTGSALTFRPVLVSPSQLLLQEKNSTLLYGVLFGLSLLATLLALFSFFATHQRGFLVATAYILVFCWFHFTVNGFDQQYFYPDNPAISDQLIGVSGFLSGALLMLLVKHFSSVQQRYPKLNRLMNFWAILLFLGACFSAIGGYPYLAPVLMLSGLLQTVFLLLLMLWLVRYERASSLLLFFMIAPSCLAVLLQVLRNLGLLSFNFWTSHLWALSSMLQISFLMLLLLVSLSRQQRQLQQQLDQNQTVQRFYQLMAHELRTPLAVISSALSNLQQQTSAIVAAKPRFERARMALARLNNLVDNALAEDRLQQLTTGLHIEEVDLQQWLNELQSLCLLTGKHQLTMRLAEGMANAHFDRQWLTLAVLNLLDNAIKYSPSGGEITLNISCDSTQWHIAVSDQGNGVPAADRLRLFERGFRSAAHQSYSGLGLGLHLVAEVVKAHAGQVHYQPQSIGSCFIISFNRI